MSKHERPLENDQDPAADRELLLQRCRELEKENRTLKLALSRSQNPGSTDDAMIVTDPEGQILYWNRAAEIIYGWSMVEAIGRSILDVIPSEQSLEEAQRIMAILQSGQTWSGQFAVKHRDGHQLMVQVTDSALLDANGRVLAIIGVSRAVTAALQPEEEFFQNEIWATETLKAIAVASQRLRSDFNRKLSLILKSVSCGVWEFDPALNHTELDDSLYELYGISRTECPLGADAIHRALHPEDRKNIFEDIPRIIRSGVDRFDLEYRVLRPDGALRHLLVRSFVDRSPDGKARKVWGVAMDHTAIKETQDQLRQMFEAISSMAIVVETNPAGIITYVNDNFCTISGYSREELIGKTHRVVNSGMHDAEFFRNLWKTIASGKKWYGEICNRRKDGTLYWVQTAITPMIGPKGEVSKYLSLRVDITDRKMAEAQILQASKMASLGEMAGGVAHEINNPVAIIMGKVDRMRKRIDQGRMDAQEFKEELAFIRETSLRIAGIVKGLLDFARGESHIQYLHTTAQRVLDQVLSFCRAHIRRHGVNLIVEPIPEISFVANQNQIVQILLNLVNNAYDAAHNTPDPWVKVDVHAVNEDLLRFIVTDAGPGIPESLRSKIMQPFFTTKPIGQGTGLGLSISHGIAAGHGGRLTLDTQGPYTTFILELPIKGPQNSKANAA
ncbi:MAG TPA: PAS domain S-box protein [Oligoflexus sp.]|uniref:PAS domain-containing sensor histidine kinase n=1 Tax=Oligoflexus sp. TaxID=1971216 RepID=UPI002D7FC0B1|nr:PAS domain S-box protein [Oligoflexus sp.]HET9239344.1 PAS domain S-box protein [Oligoflexus sp.]